MTAALDDLDRRIDALENAIHEARQIHAAALSAIDAQLRALEATTAPRRPRWNAQLAVFVCAGVTASAVIALLFQLAATR